MVYILDKEIKTSEETLKSLEQALILSMNEHDNEAPVEVKNPVTLHTFTFYDKQVVSVDELKELNERSVFGIYSHYQDLLNINVGRILQTAIIIRTNGGVEALEVQLHEDIFSAMYKEFPEGSLDSIEVWDLTESKG